MGIWFPSADIATDEKIRYTAVGNSFQDRRLIGGKVIVTDQRLLFVPNRLDGITGGQHHSIRLGDIRDVQTLEPGRRAVKKRGFGAALRPQIEIDIGAEAKLVVTVNDPDGLLRTLQP